MKRRAELEGTPLASLGRCADDTAGAPFARRAFLARGAGLVVGAGALASGCATAPFFDPATRSARDDGEGVVHIGNATHLVVLDGVRVLTDPWLREPADSVLYHRVPPAPLPTHVDVVLITHEHDDHFDESALALIDKSATVVIAGWLEQRVKNLGFKDVRGLVHGDTVDARGIRFRAVRALHDVDEVAFRFERGGRAIFFGGDTLPTREIEALAIAEPVDLAILPADGGALVGKRWVMSPDEARAMAERFGVRHDKRGAMLTHHECVVPFPWNTIVDVKPPVAADFPPWFKIPAPGERIPFPWSSA